MVLQKITEISMEGASKQQDSLKENDNRKNILKMRKIQLKFFRMRKESLGNLTLTGHSEVNSEDIASHLPGELVRMDRQMEEGLTKGRKKMLRAPKDRKLWRNMIAHVLKEPGTQKKKAKLLMFLVHYTRIKLIIKLFVTS